MRRRRIWIVDGERRGVERSGGRGVYFWYTGRIDDGDEEEELTQAEAR